MCVLDEILNPSDQSMQDVEMIMNANKFRKIIYKPDITLFRNKLEFITLINHAQSIITSHSISGNKVKGISAFHGGFNKENENRRGITHKRVAKMLWWKKMVRMEIIDIQHEYQQGGNMYITYDVAQ